MLFLDFPAICVTVLELSVLPCDQLKANCYELLPERTIAGDRWGGWKAIWAANRIGSNQGASFAGLYPKKSLNLEGRKNNSEKEK